jgi:excisionase family DNA binding protein
MQITFDQLPAAVATLLSKLELLEKQILKLQTSGREDEAPLNVAEAAEFLKIPKNTLYALVSRRVIAPCKPAKILYFYKKELNEWVKASRQKTVAEIKEEARKGVRLG